MRKILGRLPEDATTNERLFKFISITNILNEENIELSDVDGGCPVLEDKSCGFKLIHNIATWEVFPHDEVAKMIIDSRNSLIKNKDEGSI